jgi:hypothetical protein
MSRFVCIRLLIVVFVVSTFVSDAKPEEITDAAEVVRVAHLARDKYLSNVGKIMTWRGNVEIIHENVAFEGEFDESGNGGTMTRYRSKRFFIADRRYYNWFTGGKYDCFTKSEGLGTERIFPDGRKELLVTESRAAFVKDFVYHYFPTYQRPPGDNEPPFYRKIHIGQQIGDAEQFGVLFCPEYQSLPFHHFVPPTYPIFVDNARFGPNVSEGGVRRSDVFREGNQIIIKVLDEEYGRPMVMRTKIVIDLSKGGTLIEYHQCETGELEHDVHWRCEMKEVNGIWVPSYTEFIDNEVFLKRLTRRMIRWKEQTLNEPVRDDEMTLLTLGARQTDLVEDYRTGTLYNIKGDEYPPSLDEQVLLDMTKAGEKISYFRLIAIGLGLLLILAACVLYYLEWRRNKNERMKKAQ